ncbi:cytochrome c biogenesis protein CcsA [Sediminitomix flava]|uniref:Cytochrome c assembly protein n=1 Tax=Sediminitomix flava TaxID=379075 RepID=A0A315ZD67_SEDFL|nr:cytochrome c biogenesis protein CcsA [Sediminitomix flava]PWJ43053.1 cytochrome c assembly protein [Sediminitomix flava]
MNNWVDFPIYAGVAFACWLVAVTVQLSASPKKDIIIQLGSWLGVAVMGLFIGLLWNHLDRPPMRTLGETRLLYSFFLPLVGLFTYYRWGYKWLLNYALGMSVLFLGINWMSPENFNKTLMPALQSPWFVPHVIVYIFSYAVLAASSLVACYGLYQYYYKKFDYNNLKLANNLVYLGFGFLTLGLLFGALWAKEAWGHYWTWDPKETWAFLTWMAYLVYMHLRYRHPEQVKAPLWSLALAFLVLMICWFGVNYLPSAQQSVHTYTQ